VPGKVGPVSTCSTMKIDEILDACTDGSVTCSCILNAMSCRGTLSCKDGSENENEEIEAVKIGVFHQSGKSSPTCRSRRICM
jgi:hypothetical protein